MYKFHNQRPANNINHWRTDWMRNETTGWLRYTHCKLVNSKCIQHFYIIFKLIFYFYSYIATCFFVLQTESRCVSTLTELIGLSGHSRTPLRWDLHAIHSYTISGSFLMIRIFFSTLISGHCLLWDRQLQFLGLFGVFLYITFFLNTLYLLCVL